MACWYRWWSEIQKGKPWLYVYSWPCPMVSHMANTSPRGWWDNPGECWQGLKFHLWSLYCTVRRSYKASHYISIIFDVVMELFLKQINLLITTQNGDLKLLICNIKPDNHYHFIQHNKKFLNSQVNSIKIQCFIIFKINYYYKLK